jgi:hypothetical protein
MTILIKDIHATKIRVISERRKFLELEKESFRLIILFMYGDGENSALKRFSKKESLLKTENLKLANLNF